MTTLKKQRYSEYQSTGIPWLPKIPVGWSLNRMKDLGEAIIGITYSPTDIVNENEGVLVLRSSNIQNGELSLKDNVFVSCSFNKRQLVRMNDILICSRNGSRALIGKNCILDERVEGQTFGAFMTIFRSKHFNFLSWFLKSQIFEQQSGVFMSSTINQLKISTLRSLDLAFPPLPAQRAIVNYLDRETRSIDREIALFEEKMMLYKKLKQSIIKDTVTRGLDKTVSLRDSCVDWIGEIPKHWKVKRVVDIAEQRKKKNLGLKNKNLLSLSYGKIKRRDFDTAFGLLPASFETYQIVVQGNIILRLTDLQNDQKSLRVGLVEEIGIITSAYLNLGFFKNECPTYFYYLLHTFDIMKVFYWQGGGLRQSMKFDDIKVLPIIIPPYEEQQAIANYLNEKTAKIDKIVKAIHEQVKLLKELRKTLINDVVTGKIRVTNTEEVAA